MNWFGFAGALSANNEERVCVIPVSDYQKTREE